MEQDRSRAISDHPKTPIRGFAEEAQGTQALPRRARRHGGQLVADDEQVRLCALRQLG